MVFELPNDSILRLPLSPEEIDRQTRPKVLIAGASLGGLTLAILLHRANVPFEVYEKTPLIEPLVTDIDENDHSKRKQELA